MENYHFTQREKIYEITPVVQTLKKKKRERQKLALGREVLEKRDREREQKHTERRVRDSRF